MVASERDFVERVKSAIDIVDVAQSYFPLTKKGERYLALCPFHREKTPSFSISTTRQIFHCFGCHKSGDVLTLVMELDRLSFPEALEQLASRAGIPLPSQGAKRDPAASQRLRLLDLMTKAADFYAGYLRSPAGSRAMDYLCRRGMSDETRDRFLVGYAPDEWRGLHDAMRSRGFRDEELLRVGLIKTSDNGNKWDLLRNRVVIPIRDGRGRVIAFGGRVLDDSTPKYVNSPETELFSKKSVLFGFDRARHVAASKGYFVVVEGYMDVIAAHQRGVENVVAALGTAFTREHASQMRRYATRTVLLFDADDAGRRATDRSATILLQEGLDVAVASLPPGLDPDDFFADRDAAAFEAYLSEHVEDLVQYLIRRARENQGTLDSVAAAAAAAREVLRVIEQTEDDVQFDLFVRKISQDFGIDERLLRRESRRADSKRQTTAPEDSRHPVKPRGMLRAWELDEIHVLQAATTDGMYARMVVSALTETDFRDSGRRLAFKAIQGLVEGARCPGPSVVLQKLKDNDAARVAFEVVLGREFPPGERPEHALERIIGRRNELEYRRLREEASRSGVLRSGEDDELNRRLAEIARYHAERLTRSNDANQEQQDGSAP